jgi:hypothetical protein
MALAWFRCAAFLRMGVGVGPLLTLQAIFGCSSENADLPVEPQFARAIFSFGYLGAPPDGRFARLLLFPANIAAPCTLFTADEPRASFTYLAVTLSEPNVGAFTIVADALADHEQRTLQADAHLVHVSGEGQDSLTPAVGGTLSISSMPTSEAMWSMGRGLEFTLGLDFPEAVWTETDCITTGSTTSAITSTECQCRKESLTMTCTTEDERSCCADLRNDSPLFRIESEMRAEQCAGACISTTGDFQYCEQLQQAAN